SGPRPTPGREGMADRSTETFTRVLPRGRKGDILNIGRYSERPLFSPSRIRTSTCQPCDGPTPPAGFDSKGPEVVADLNGTLQLLPPIVVGGKRFFVVEDRPRLDLFDAHALDAPAHKRFTEGHLPVPDDMILST